MAELYSGLWLAAERVVGCCLTALPDFASCELATVLRVPFVLIPAGEPVLLAAPEEPLPEIFSSLLEVPAILFHFEEELLCLSLLPYAIASSALR